MIRFIHKHLQFAHACCYNRPRYLVLLFRKEKARCSHINGPAHCAKNRLDGATNVPASGGDWSWGNIRNINYYLENMDKVADSQKKNQYIGEGYFFRVWYYFEMLKQFGALPIITKPVNVGDTNILYDPRSSKTDVVNFILSDIDEAIFRLRTPAQAGANRLNQHVAQIFKARVTL